MWRSFRDTAVVLTTRLILVVDRDDPTIDEYIPPSTWRGRYGHDADHPFVIGLDPSESGGLVRATNTAAARLWDRDHIVGHVGDDHRFRTPGWDRAIADALRDPGIAYANDGHWGPKIATAPFMSAVIPRSLGWYALPTCQHNGWDNAVVALGDAAGCLRYLPDVLIEHPDPDLRRQLATTDPGYAKARASQADDRRAFHAWRRDDLQRDAATVRAALDQAVAA